MLLFSTNRQLNLKVRVAACVGLLLATTSAFADCSSVDAVNAARKALYPNGASNAQNGYEYMGASTSSQPPTGTDTVQVYDVGSPPCDPTRKVYFFWKKLPASSGEGSVVESISGGADDITGSANAKSSVYHVKTSGKGGKGK